MKRKVDKSMAIVWRFGSWSSYLALRKRKEDNEHQKTGR